MKLKVFSFYILVVVSLTGVSLRFLLFFRTTAGDFVFPASWGSWAASEFNFPGVCKQGCQCRVYIHIAVHHKSKTLFNYPLAHLDLTISFGLANAGRGRWTLSLLQLKRSMAEVPLSSLTEIKSDNCRRQKHIYRVLCLKLIRSHKKGKVSWALNCSKFIHGDLICMLHRPVMKPLSVLSGWLMRHASHDLICFP